MGTMLIVKLEPLHHFRTWSSETTSQLIASRVSADPIPFLNITMDLLENSPS